jgi:hypothetical protein
MTGSKIYQMAVRYNSKFAELVFRDSYLLTLSPLDNLKDTFGLECSSKPFFPYLWNARSNLHSVLDTLPPREMYIPNSMMPKKREKFMKWYDENFNTPFILEKALDEYCHNDTDILLKAIVKMRSLLISITNGYDVLLKACTIAGIAIRIFRKLFLEEETLAIVPETGYEKVDRASDKAIKYFEWLSKKNNIHIQHAGNGREKKFLMMDPVTGQTFNMKVDGYYEKLDLIFEFLGW